jgi:hypothetical protein
MYKIKKKKGKKPNAKKKPFMHILMQLQKENLFFLQIRVYVTLTDCTRLMPLCSLASHSLGKGSILFKPVHMGFVVAKVAPAMRSSSHPPQITLVSSSSSFNQLFINS